MLGEKFVIFRSYSPKKNERNIKEVKWKNWTYFNSFSIDDKSLMEYYNYLIKYKVKFMRTYPSTLAISKIPKVKQFRIKSENDTCE